MRTFRGGQLLLCLAACALAFGCCEPHQTERNSRGKAPARDKAPATPPAREASQGDDRALICEHVELARQGKSLSSEQRELFADAYYRLGAKLLRSGKYAESEPYFRTALELQPRHARAILRLGDLCALKRQFRAAAQAYTRACELDPRLREAARKRRIRLADRVLLIADQRLGDYQAAKAKEALVFIQQCLGDVRRREVQERLDTLQPMLGAERLLAEAKEAIARARHTDGFEKLRQVATNYPGSYYEQQANRILEEHGQQVVVSGTVGGFVIPSHWGRTSTAHFVVYYEDDKYLSKVTRALEDTFDRMTRTFGMDDVEWRTKITVYFFDDREAWNTFVQTNPDKTFREWAYALASPDSNEAFFHLERERDQLLKHTVPHEIAHVLHYRYVGGIEQPIFLQEGIAIFMERRGVREARDEITRRVKRGTHFPLTELLRATDFPEKDVRLFYMQSATVVGFIVEEYGVDGLKELMFAFKSLDDPVRAIEEVYGISLDTFEEKWEKYVR